jgi:uncharacterized protein (TIGR00375 family)
MDEYFVDLHIHIGRTSSGKPVKITGAKSLTIENILIEATEVKGLDMIGVIDCHVPEVLDELHSLIQKGNVIELEDGGLRFKDVTLILGAEIEIYDENCKGPIHVLAFLPTVKKMREFSLWMSTRQKNITLSSQRLYETGLNLQEKVRNLNGIFIPAHIFTPYKSLYGKGVNKSLTEVFNPSLIDAVELGLSSNTQMADQIKELHCYSYVTNSDAHSLSKIGREYQKVCMQSPTFEELRKALKQQDGRKIVANYGLDPKLGKYHRTTCDKCFTLIEDKTAIVCPSCGYSQIVKGVYDRILELQSNEGHHPIRPSYIHQVPLEFIPGLGPKTMEKLRDYFKTEMTILHDAPFEILQEILPTAIATAIEKARNGTLSLQSGGGGKYGKVK